MQGRQRYQDTREPIGREKGRPEAPGKGDGEPKGEPQQTQAHTMALSQRVSGKWFPLAGGQGGSFHGGRAGWEPRGRVRDTNALNRGLALEVKRVSVWPPQPSRQHGPQQPRALEATCTCQFSRDTGPRAAFYMLYVYIYVYFG